MPSCHWRTGGQQGQHHILGENGTHNRLQWGVRRRIWKPLSCGGREKIQCWTRWMATGQKIKTGSRVTRLYPSPTSFPLLHPSKCLLNGFNWLIKLLGKSPLAFKFFADPQSCERRAFRVPAGDGPKESAVVKAAALGFQTREKKPLESCPLESVLP